jgi:hypothetical protein
MATIGSTRGTDIPNIDNTLSVSNKTVNNTLLSRGFKITPDAYTTIDDLIKATKEDVMPDLVKTYGDQGITGFLKLTGAISSGGSSDQVDWWEEGRRHRAFDYSSSDYTDNDTNLTISSSSTEGAKFCANVQKNDVVMCAETGTRYIVQAGGFTTGTATDAVLVKMDNTAVGVAGTDYVASGGKFLVIGNIYGQGTNQPTGFTDPGIIRYTNPYMIVKDRYEVNGSQATNIGYVNLGNGDYRWFMYGEKEARARFEDKRELMMLFGEKRATGSAATALDNALAGSEGYFSAIENRGIQVASASSNPLDSFSEFDDIIIELDKQGYRRHVGCRYRYWRYCWSPRSVRCIPELSRHGCSARIQELYSRWLHLPQARLEIVERSNDVGCWFNQLHPGRYGAFENCERRPQRCFCSCSLYALQGSKRLLS